jgi:nitroimidazol reductase NimA-like FMN-containing flavoprotein (pyridoxamine 5'-phosphate oxidase superfamily)
MAQRRNAPQKRSIPAKTKRGSISVPERLDALNQRERHAVLSTDAKGRPYTSLVTFALLPGCAGAIFATPKETVKYRNILENPHVALLIDNRSNREEDLMGAEAITIIGRARPVRRGKKWKELTRILVEKHPALSGFVRSPSTALVLIEISHCIHVSQFQTVTRWDILSGLKF